MEDLTLLTHTSIKLGTPINCEFECFEVILNGEVDLFLICNDPSYGYYIYTFKGDEQIFKFGQLTITRDCLIDILTTMTKTNSTEYIKKYHYGLEIKYNAYEKHVNITPFSVHATPTISISFLITRHTDTIHSFDLIFKRFNTNVEKELVEKLFNMVGIVPKEQLVPKQTVSILESIPEPPNHDENKEIVNEEKPSEDSIPDNYKFDSQFRPIVCLTNEEIAGLTKDIDRLKNTNKEKEICNKQNEIAIKDLNEKVAAITSTTDLLVALMKARNKMFDQLQKINTEKIAASEKKIIENISEHEHKISSKYVSYDELKHILTMIFETMFKAVLGKEVLTSDCLKK